jgi:type IV pilus assembly protein PilB
MLTAERFKDEWVVRALIENGLVDQKAVDALRLAGAPYVCAELLRRKTLTKDQIAEAVRRQYRVAFEETASDPSGAMALSLIPERLCRKHSMVPFRVEEDRIDVLMSNPLDMVALDDAASVSGRRPRPFFGFPERVEELIQQGYSSDAVVLDILKKLPDEALDKLVIAAPVVRLADGIIAQAVRMKASDIHVEQEEFSTVVRYRIDGDLRSMMTLPKFIGEGPLVSRIKIMANLDVADRRRPQDGRAKLLVGRQEFGLRVSTIPTAFGEKAVLRILDPRSAQVPLETLGFRPTVLERMLRLSHSDKGMLLITGPTGSGKTTTLYSILNELKSVKINVVTVEDPIEYRLAGVNQVQVNEKAGLTFAAVLRSVLRQDPDVLLVGEIRDRETAEIALQAALTGHMVFSTLHTNDAVSTIDRLLDMGIERFKLAPALVGIVSQRLVRRICPDCRIEETPIPLIAELLKKWSLPVRKFRGKGCDKCAFSGILGRTAVVELLDLSEETARDLVASETDTAAFRGECLKQGWLLTMEQGALWHLSDGRIDEQDAMALLRTPHQEHSIAAPAPQAPPDPAPAAAAPPAPAAECGRRILIVDDNMDNRTLICDTLGSEGHTLIEAENGLIALEKVHSEKPDLVLLDIMMPVLDGFAVLKRLRGQMGLIGLPILILTAMSEAESQSLALEIGADDYMTKPFNPGVLRSRVRALIRRSEYRAAAAGNPPVPRP